MNRLGLLLCLSLVAGCARQPEGALRVEISTADALKADCVRLAVSDDKGNELKSLVLSRANMRNAWKVGVVQGKDLPKTVTFQATAHLGTCTDETTFKLASRSPPVTATFPETTVEQVNLKLDPADATLDADRDGYVAVTLGGADCNDDAAKGGASIFPGSVQLCTSEVDTDCDGQGACADSDCGSAAECVSPPDRVVFRSVPATQLRYACTSAITVELQNAAGLRNATASTDVTLGSSLAGAQFFSDSSCTVPTTSVRIPFMSGQATVFLKSTDLGTAELTASATGLTSGRASVTILPTAVSQLKFTTPPRSLQAGVCGTDLVTLGVVDSNGLPTVTDQPLNVTLSALPSDMNGNFFAATDTACTPAQRLTSISIPAGAGEVSFRIRSERATPAMTPMVLNANSGMLMATQNVTVSPAAASKLGFLNTPLSMTSVMTCSPGKLQLQVQDAFGNRAPSPSDVVLDLSAMNLSNFTFYDALAGMCTTPITSITIAAGASDAELYVRGMTPSSNGSVVITPRNTFAQVTQAVYVSAGAPTRIALQGAKTITAGECTPTPITLTALDATNVPAAFATPQTVILSTAPTPASFAFYSQAGCGGAALGSTVTFPAGQTQLNLYFRGTIAVASFAITASITGFGSDTLGGNSIVAGPPAVLAWNPSSRTTTAGTCTAQGYTLNILDNFTNSTRFASDTTLTVSSTLAGVTIGTNSAACSSGSTMTIPASTTFATFYATHTVAATYALTATAGTASTSSSGQLVVNPGTATELRIVSPSPNPAAVTAGGCVQVRLERRDSLNNLVPVGTATTLNVGTLPSGVTAHADQTSCMNGTGAATTFAMAATDSQRTFWLRATRTNAMAVITPYVALQPALTATITLVVSPAAASALEFIGLPLSRASDVCSNGITVRRRDPFNNDATLDPDITVNVTSSAPLNFYTTSDCTGTAASSAAVTITSGNATSGAFSMKSATVTMATLTGASGSLTSATGSFSVTPGTPSRLVFSGAGANVGAGSCSGSIGFTVRDANNNLSPVSAALSVDLTKSPMGDSVTFYSDGACTTASTTTQVASGQSSGAFSFRSNTVNSALQVSIGSTGFTGASQTWNVQIGPPAAITWKTPPQSPIARFGCSSVATVELRDLGGNLSPAPGGGTTLTLNSSAANAGITFFSDSACTTPVTMVTVPAAATETSFYFTATGNTSTNLFVTGSGLTNSPTQNVSITPVTASFAVTMANTELEAGGCEAVTVTRQDMAMSPITRGSTPMTLTSDNAAVTLHTASNCSGTGASSQSTTIAHGTSAVTFYARGRSAAALTAVTLTASDTSGGVSNGTRTLNAYPLVRRGSCNVTNNNLTSRCTLSPSIPGNVISRSFLVFSSTGDTQFNDSGTQRVRPTDGNVECHLETSTTVDVVCSRSDSHQQVDVEYQVVSWGRSYANGGVTVQHLQANSAAATTTDVTLPTPVTSPASTFVLFSSKSLGGEINDANDFDTARLLDASTVRIAASSATSIAYSLQIVEFAGATVTRGTTTLSGATAQVTAPGDNARSFVLYSTYLSDTMSNDSYICKRRLRGRLHSNGTNIDFRRGAGGGGAGTNCTNSDVLELAWERVQLPVCSAGTGCTTAQSQVSASGGATNTSPTSQLTNGNGTTTWNITAVTTHRSIVFSGGQGPGGQSAGEGNYNDTNGDTGDDTGALHARFYFNSASQVGLTRAVTGDTANFIPFVVQFDP